MSGSIPNEEVRSKKQKCDKIQNFPPLHNILVLKDVSWFFLFSFVQNYVVLNHLFWPHKYRPFALSADAPHHPSRSCSSNLREAAEGLGGVVQFLVRRRPPPHSFRDKMMSSSRSELSELSVWATDGHRFRNVGVLNTAAFTFRWEGGRFLA